MGSRRKAADERKETPTQSVKAVVPRPMNSRGSHGKPMAALTTASAIHDIPFGT